MYKNDKKTSYLKQLHKPQDKDFRGLDYFILQKVFVEMFYVQFFF